MRPDKRAFTAIRPITFQRGFTKYAPGSVLVSYGDTKVLCTASIEDRVPSFLRDSGQGWLSAEYALLPTSTHTRNQRESSKGKLSGRTHEIQRLIGRSLRAVVDFSQMGERTLQVDADVLQADGGTRTAAITGSMIAVWDAFTWLSTRAVLSHFPVKELLAAVSVGIVNGQVSCDLCYEEDSAAEVDMNLVMTASGRYVEIQGTAEEATFDAQQLQDMLRVGGQAIEEILVLMRQELGL